VALPEQAEAAGTVHGAMSVHEDPLAEEGYAQDRVVPEQVHVDAWECLLEVSCIRAKMGHGRNSYDAVRVADKNVGAVLGRQRCRYLHLARIVVRCHAPKAAAA